MATRITVTPLSAAERIADTLMVPLMYLASGTIREAPQEIHHWNNRRLSAVEIENVARALEAKVHVSGIAGEREARHCFGLIPTFHLPIAGGWRNYVVLTPTTHAGEWYCGLLVDMEHGWISRRPVTGPVRKLIGPGPATFFGVRAGDNELISVARIGYGYIGRGGPYKDLPLQ